MSTEDIAAIGIALETDGVEKGIRALDVLASKGPAVEKSMGQVEGAAKRTGKSLETLGRGTALDGLAQTSATAAAGMEKLGASSGKAQAALSGQATAAKSAVSSFDSLKTAVSGFTQSESQYIQKLVDEAKQLGMTRSERERYIAQSRGMSESAQQVAAAIGAKIDAYKREQTELGKTAGAAKDSAQSMLSLARTGVSAVLGGAVVQGAMAASKAMFDASANAERLRTMLDFSTGGNSAREIEYLRGVTYRLGLEFSSTAKAYGQFRAAAKGTALEGDKARAVFESVAKASAVMGLSADQSSGVLLALQQMISKGTVQAEELRGQLGERLPGAFQIAAKAMGVTTAELGKMLEQGQVIADDFLPKFAAALEKNLGDAAEKAAGRLDASVNRVASAWERLKQNAGDSGVSRAVAGELEAITRDLTAVSDAMENTRKAGGGMFSQLAAGGGVAVGRTVFSTLNLAANTLNGTINALTGSVFGLRTDLALLPDVFKTNDQQTKALAANLKQAEAEFAALQARGAANTKNIYLQSSYFQLQEYIKELKAAQDEQAKLTGGAAANQNMNAGVTASGQARERFEKQRAADVESANAFRLNQSGVPPSYLKDMQELIRLNQAGVLVGKEYTDALAKQQTILLQKTGVTKNSAAAANAEQNAYESLIASIRAKIEEDRLELAGGEALTESQRMRIKLDQDLLAGRIKLGSAREADVRAAIQEKAESEAQVAAMRVLNKANLEAAQTRDKYLASLSTGTEKIRADILAQEEATARMGLSREAIADLDAAKLDMLATDTELQAIKALDRNLDQQTYDSLKEQAKLYRDLAAAKRVGAAKETALEIEKANEEAARKAAEDWQRTADDINRSLTDALMRGFESGKDFARNLRDTIVNMFKTLVLRPVISAIVNPVAGAVTGALGLAGAANAGQSALSTVGSIGSIGSGFSLLAGLGNFGGGLAGGLSGLMGSLGLSATGATIGGAMSAGGIALQAGNIAGGLGTIAGALGPIAIGIALLSSFIKKSTPHMGAASSYSAAGGLTSGVDVYRASGLADTRTYSAEAEAVTAPIARSIGMALDSVATTFGKKAGYEISTAFADDKSKDGAWGSLVIKRGGESIIDWRDDQTSKWAPREFADGEAGAKEYQKAIALSARDALKDAIGEVDWATDMLDALGDSPALEGLAQTVDQINAIQLAFGQFGKLMPQFADLSQKALSKLTETVGGAGTLARSMDVFSRDYFSEAERQAVVRADLTAEFGKLGFSLPRTRDELKALIQAQWAMGEGGAETAGKLLQLTEAFSSVTQSAEEAAEMARASAEKARSNALAQLDASAQRERALWTAQADAAASLRNEVQGIFDTLAANIRELRNEGMGAALSAAQGRAFIASAQVAVQAGAGLPDKDALADAIAAARGGITASGVYGNSIEREFAALALAGELAVLQEAAGEQLSTAELQLRAAESQIEQLDETLGYWRKLLDGTKAGIDATLSVADAVRSLQALMFPEADKPAAPESGSGGFVIGGGGGGGGGAPAPSPATLSRLGNIYLGAGGTAIVDRDYIDRFDSINQFVNTLDFSVSGAAASIAALTGAAQEHGVSANEIAIATGYRLEDVEALLPGIPRYKRGTNFVPEDGLAWLHKGEQVLPVAPQGAPYQPPMADNGQVVALLQQIAERVAALESHASTSADANTQTADVLTRASQGDALTTAAAPTIA